MFEQITFTGSAIATLNPQVYGSAAKAIISISGSDIRVRLDKTAPTTSIGIALAAGGIFTLTSKAEIQAFRAISTGTTTLNIQYLVV